MTQRPGTRRALLVVHVGCSVAWLGAIAASLVLAVAGLLDPDPAVVRAVYLALALIGWWALVPLSVASLLSGLVQSLTGQWGLLRHYWVLIKLLMNLLASAVLLMYTQTLDQLAAVAHAATTAADVDRLRDPSPIVHSAAAVLLLVAALVLSIYKPRGLTAYGWRRQHDRPRLASYDRRGYSRSTLLDQPPDDHDRLAADADDLAALITKLAGGPAAVFGNSSGATVALQLLIDHPGAATTVIAHEPPLMRLLPDADRWLTQFATVYDTYQQAGIPAAMRAFTTGVFTDRDRRAMHQQTMRHDNDRYREADTRFWLEHELRVYPGVTLDLNRLAEQADHVVPAAGAESRDYPTHRAGQALAQRLGRPLTELPGGHIGCLTDAAAFADVLARICKLD